MQFEFEDHTDLIDDPDYKMMVSVLCSPYLRRFLTGSLPARDSNQTQKIGCDERSLVYTTTPTASLYVEWSTQYEAPSGMYSCDCFRIFRWAGDDPLIILAGMGPHPNYTPTLLVGNHRGGTCLFGRAWEDFRSSGGFSTIVETYLPDDWKQFAL